MTLLRRMLLVLILAVAISTIAIPNVKAQTTNITSLQAPSTTTVGTDVTVAVAIAYDLGANGSAVSIGIFDLDGGSWAVGTGTSSQNTCHQYTGELWGHAYCTYTPTSTTGTDVITFELLFTSAKTYRLRASVELFDANVQLISSASMFQDFTIAVSAATTSLTSTQSYTTSTPSLQLPQPPQTSTIPQSTSNMPQLTIAAVAVIAVIIGGVFLYTRRRKTSKVTKAEKIEPKSEKTTPSKNFCIECGKELELGSKFCINCGTEQL
jgi:hypothetical protein